MKATVTAIVLLALLAACSNGPKPESDAPPATDTISAPQAKASFVGFFKGTLPCADCPGIETQLWVRADSSFFLLEHYIDRDTVPYGSFGRWLVVNDLLATGSGTDKPDFWRRSSNGLVGVDEAGQEFDKKFRMELPKAGDGSGAIPSMRLQGLYRYKTGASSYSAFDSEFAYPLDITAARDGIVRMQNKDGGPVGLEIEAHTKQEPAAEGTGTEEYLVLERVVREVE